MKTPTLLWAVIDKESPVNHGVLDWFTTRREAREKCAAFNRMPGYEPTCIVVRYEASPKRSNA